MLVFIRTLFIYFSSFHIFYYFSFSFLLLFNFFHSNQERTKEFSTKLIVGKGNIFRIEKKTRISLYLSTSLSICFFLSRREQKIAPTLAKNSDRKGQMLSRRIRAFTASFLALIAHWHILSDSQPPVFPVVIVFRKGSYTIVGKRKRQKESERERMERKEEGKNRVIQADG